MDFIFATRYKSGGVDSRHVGTFNLYILGIREIAIVSEISRMGKIYFRNVLASMRALILILSLFGRLFILIDGNHSRLAARSVFCPRQYKGDKTRTNRSIGDLAGLFNGFAGI